MNKNHLKYMLLMLLPALFITKGSAQQNKTSKDTSGLFSMVTSARFVKTELGIKKDTNQLEEIISRDIDIPGDPNKIYVHPGKIRAGDTITIGVHLLDEGYYTCQFTNENFLSVQQMEIRIDAEARTIEIPVLQISRGNYFIVLTNKKSGKKYSEKFQVQ